MVGEIYTGKIAIEPNAIFSGTCKMGEYTSRNEH